MEDKNSVWQAEVAKFSAEHRADTDEQLLELLRDRAAELGRAPTKQEFYGSALLKGRFGPWPRVLIAAGLKEAPDPALKEIRKQRIEKQDKERRAASKAEPSRSKRKAEQEKLAYAQLHSTDSDEELLAELKRYSEAKGKTPSKDEYPGSLLLAERFGNWRDAVLSAGLELKHAELSKRTARKLMSEEERRAEQRELTRTAQQRKQNETKK